jgi:hypothetical protein
VRERDAALGVVLRVRELRDDQRVLLMRGKLGGFTELA